jgi:hypothetical protein
MDDSYALELKIYRDCIAELDEIEKLILDKKNQNTDLIQGKMRDLKVRWRRIRRSSSDSAIELVINEALVQLEQDARTNTRPGQKWLDAIDNAKLSLENAIGKDSQS